MADGSSRFPSPLQDLRRTSPAEPSARGPNPEVLRYPQETVRRAVRSIPTPFFLYEETRIREACRRITSAFAPRFEGFTPLFAVKANPNPHILRIIADEGFGFDCSSPSEAWVVDTLGGRGMYTGNYTTRSEYELVHQLGGLSLNLDDASALPVVESIGMPRFLSFRVNPDMKPSRCCVALAGRDAKYGIPWQHAAQAYRRARDLGVERFGIHAMTGTNILDPGYFVALTERLFDLMGQIKREVGIDFDQIDIGGGFGVPYHPDEPDLDLEEVAVHLRRVFDEKCREHGLREPTLVVEPGRFVTASSGYLVSRVHVIKDGYKRFVGVDAGMNDLLRPGLYGAYHHISVLDKEPGGTEEVVNVVGRLCENTDQFAKDRALPPMEPGDVVVLHTAGGHGYSQSYNYNGRLRSAEVLLTTDGTLRPIRRAETIDDLYRTVVDWR